MFGFARAILRHKFLVIGAIALGIFFMSGNDDAAVPSSPWAANASAPVATSQAGKTSLTDKALKVADSAAKMAGVEEYSPLALKDQAVGGFDKTQSAVAKVNKD